MDNQKIIKVSEMLKEKQIPQIMLKNRQFNDNQSIAEIVSEVESDFQTITAIIKSGEKANIEGAVDTLNDWGNKGAK